MLKVNTASASLTTNIILGLFRYCGNIGNIIFMICSAYFLLDSKKGKKEKVLYMISDTVVISILWLIPTLMCGFRISNRTIVEQFTPVIHGNNWFIGCYLLLYLMHPILNMIVDRAGKMRLFRICLASSLLYFCIQFIVSGALFFNHLIFYVILYFIVAYNKRYAKKISDNSAINMVCLIVSTFAWSLFVIIPCLAHSGEPLNDNVFQYVKNIGNPFGVIVALSLFNLFNVRSFYNKIINYLSSLSLLFYIIHVNYLFRELIRPRIYMESLALFDNKTMWAITMTAGLILFGIASSMIYKATIQKIIMAVAAKVYPLLSRAYIVVESGLMRRLR